MVLTKHQNHDAVLSVHQAFRRGLNNMSNDKSLLSDADILQWNREKAATPECINTSLQYK